MGLLWEIKSIDEWRKSTEIHTEGTARVDADVLGRLNYHVRSNLQACMQNIDWRMM